ncbi:Calx-beta domain-containing protein [Paenibacillus sp. 1001270B_150601_E10]|uniref:Calx-beta domain-containing protein n=1 Tax=Paenibacillus sp. 1001270B_150601_E10 TaxID=2787079 RepID=UPI00189E11E2|nr:Calx-beta domain-containing protein [Paenibacillus sp. 1001270B_150601_E10]
MSLSIGKKLTLSLVVSILMLLIVSSPKQAEASTCSFYVGFQYDITNLDFPGGKFLAKENIGVKQIKLTAYTPKPNESGSVVLNVYGDRNANDEPLHSFTVTFTDQAPTQIVEIPIQDDNILNENIRELYIQLSNPSPNVCFYEEDGWHEALLYILDNEPPTLRIRPAEASYDLAEGSEKMFEIKRLGDLSVPVSYQITDTPVTAQPSDYIISPTEGAFPTEFHDDYVLDWLNSQVEYVWVEVLNDSELESTETFKMNITSPNAQIDGPSSIEFRILGNDGGSSATIQLQQSSYSTWEYINVLPVTITRSGNLTKEVSVFVSTANGSAKRDKDFGFEPVRVTFAPGQQSAVINLYIIDDGSWEGNETFTLKLSDAQGGAVLGSVQQATITILDNEKRSN